jgi:hypothetical protein
MTVDSLVRAMRCGWLLGFEAGVGVEQQRQHVSLQELAQAVADAMGPVVTRNTLAALRSVARSEEERKVLDELVVRVRTRLCGEARLPS